MYQTQKNLFKGHWNIHNLIQKTGNCSSNQQRYSCVRDIQMDMLFIKETRNFEPREHGTIYRCVPRTKPLATQS